jgi:ATP-dependent DNA helicase RecG
MNQCETILKEIHRRLSYSAKSQDLTSNLQDHKELLKLIQQCLNTRPAPQTVLFLNDFRGKLSRANQASAEVQRPFIVQMNRDLDRFLMTGALRDTPSPLSQTVRYVKGVGERVAALLAKLDIHTVEDLICFFPYRYEDRRNLVQIAHLPTQGFVTIQGVVRSVDLSTTRKKGFRIFQLLIEDRTGMMVAKWFNQAYLKKVFQPGQRVILSGKVKWAPYSRGLEIENPEYEILQEGDEETIHTNRIVPIYHTTAGLTQRRIRTILFHLLASHLQEIEEFFPDEILSKYHLPERPDSVAQLHFPDHKVPVERLNAFRSPYHKRMIFEEFLLLELLLAIKRQARPTEVQGIAFQVVTEAETSLIQSLPFPLTSAQKRVIQEIKHDMGRPSQMSRLLQGDVGCGKTIVAAVAAGIALENTYQVAVMAPTEILAEQLYFHFRRYVGLLGKNTALLTRLIKNKEKEELRTRIQQGEIDVVVGTHALIQNEVIFKRLGLVVIDEQHRFGVIQRASLMNKGDSPDVLVMTATPIPRSLSLTVYGDLDISVIDEMPPGRSPVHTEIVRSKGRRKVYSHIDQEVSKGRQAYIIYPLVEESEKIDLAAATEMSEHLARDIFPQRKIGLLHGRMKPEEKETIMESFKEGALHILVSTTVVEVGIDIPNATLMVIEHAERFGLAQLHQLRGRVGRGVHPSTCYLMISGRMTEEAARRLSVMSETTDGFKIAEEDLEIRGPGEFFGKKQSGMPDLKMGNILRDIRILEAAREEAFARVKSDPLLQDPGNVRLLSEMQKRYAGKSSLIRVG